MKKLIGLIAVVIVLSTSSCQKKKCSMSQTYRGADSTLVTEKLEWETYGSCADYYEAPGYQPGAYVNEYPQYGPNTDPNQNGGTPSTGGAPGTYTNPIEDYSVFHEGEYQFINTDPLFVNGPHPDLSSRRIRPDIDQDGSLDLESGGVANHFVTIRGMILVNGYYYKAVCVVDETKFQSGGSYQNVKYGDVIPNAVTYSNKPYGYIGQPGATPKVNGVYFISPGGERYYFLLG